MPTVEVAIQQATVHKCQALLTTCMVDSLAQQVTWFVLKEKTPKKSTILLTKTFRLAISQF